MPLPSSPFTQGGQTQIHKLRMLKQVVISTIQMGCLGAVLGWAMWFCVHNSPVNLWMFLAYGWAHGMAELSRILGSFQKFCFCVIDGQLKPCSASWFLMHPYPKMLWQQVCNSGKQALYGALMGGFGTSFMVIFYFLKKGKQLHQTQKLKGFDLVDLKGFQRFLKKNKIETSLTLDMIPIPKEAETKHFMITGTTGSGKTNAIHHLLKALEGRGDKVVMVDTTGGYVKRFYNPHRDVILNPLDDRSVHWNLFLECDNASDAMEVGSLLVPKPSYQSDFWAQSARLMLAEGIRITQDHDPQKPLEFLQNLLLREPLSQVATYFHHTNIASYFSGKTSETAQSIRMTLATSLGSLGCLKEAGNFSIKKWVHDETQQGYLFLACDPTQRDYMQSLLTCWFGLSIKAMMGLSENPNRRVWFILDELASLNAIPSLPTALAEVRKYGGCLVLGFQNMFQIEDLYGPSMTASLSELTGTKMIFQCVDHKVATRMAQMLGQQEVLEASENISFGANEIRDGVSLSHHKKSTNLVTATDLFQLIPLSCYLKTAFNAPVFKTKMGYLDVGS